MTHVHIFRIDLRLDDNPALQESILMGPVLPLFIFDERQIKESENPYFSNKSVQFLIESLQDLDTSIKKKSSGKSQLVAMSGQPTTILSKIQKSLGIESVSFNNDYSPFSIERDSKIEKWCVANDINIIRKDSITLHPPDQILSGGGVGYKVFGAYYKKASMLAVRKDKKFKIGKGFLEKTKKLKTVNDWSKYYTRSDTMAVHGGRNEAKKILRNMKKFKNYNKTRDYPAYDTTRLSAYLKYGCVSIFETFHVMKQALGNKNELFKQLYWRDFYYQLLFHHPELQKEPLKKKYKSTKWKTNKINFDKWKNGMTGIPFVDAGMRELNETGFMHNRSRLIVGSFLTKNLMVDWKKGEKYFATKLIDVSPSSNNGNWQWVASVGVDYMVRIYNPFTQSKKYDPDCKYIKKWVIELRDVPTDDIHNWDDKYKDWDDTYLKPIVDVTKTYKEAKKYYKDQ